MRLLLGIFACFLSGCLTTYNTERAQDLCTNAGMAYEGFTIVNNDGGGHVRCVNPEDDEQRCNVMKAQAELREKKAYNSRWSGKNILLGIGYSLYYLPGYLLYEYWEDDAQADMDATNKRIVETKMSECEAIAH